MGRTVTAWRAWGLGLALGLAMSVAGAQGGPRVEVRAVVPPSASGTPGGAGPMRPVGESGMVWHPQVAARNVLDERAFDELIRSGFPARLHFRVELWSIGRWFDDLNGRAEWDVIVRYDVLDRVYDVARITRDGVTPLGTYARFADARMAAESPHGPAIGPPPRGRRSYLAVRLEAQTLEVSDLDEVQRWLRGEAQPAIRGRRNPGTALTRGARALVSRLLGAQVRQLEARTAPFTW